MNNKDIARSVGDPWMQRMFNSAAGKYGISNKILTFGQDEKWRQAAVDVIRPQANVKILDICTGTADLALKIAGRFSDSDIYALDFSPKMLVVARKRTNEEAIHNLIFKEGDCANMEFDNDYFDCVTISFGFRNLSYSWDNLASALKEIYRVLKKGGRFIILETSHPTNSVFRWIFHFYAARIIPLLGEILSGEPVPYAYLGSSILKFFNRNELISVVESAGLRLERTSPFMFGAILLCVFQK